jgi:uncharacterized phage infection (PIP) family protein YhgE
MQNILNKLHKFTSAQKPIKVEFGVAEDVASLAGNGFGEAGVALQRLRRAKEVADKIFSLKDDLAPLIKEAQSIRAEAAMNEVEGFLADFDKLKSKISQAAKELGIDPSSIKYYDQLAKNASSIESAYKQVQGVDKALSREINR